MNIAFEKKLDYLQEKYRSDYTPRFNIFSVLHKKHDERRLHSRFIASLLNPNGSHEQGNIFLKEFIDRLELIDFSLSEVEIFPKEDEKAEWKDIDIYIKSGRKVLIIENKIFAGDSNKAIANDHAQAQLLHYFDKVKQDFNLSEDEALADIRLVYLTLNGKKPSLIQQFNSRNVTLHCIDYIQFITEWLQLCIAHLDQCYLRDAIQQYLQLITSITNDYKLTMELRSLIVDNMDSAFEMYLTGNNTFFKEEFKHVKWHTVHEFWQELSYGLREKFNCDVTPPHDDIITAVTHRGVKRNLVLTFLYKGNQVYIANDSKGFTCGVVYSSTENFQVKQGFKKDGLKVWKKMDDLNDYILLCFEDRRVFNLIDIKLRSSLVEIIISKLAKVLFDEEQLRIGKPLII